MSPENIILLLAELPALVFILWLSHRMTTHTIPRLAGEFLSGIERQREDFKDSLLSQREEFKDALKCQREEFHREMERERQVHGDLINQVVQAIRDSNQSGG